ncbi:MAG: F0F1 ATP synthase subunit A [Candidatus Levybacteria bacterium]|nr:F0F1 ATP synthase subunit A [Candidatus Levybacteria bacterium]
MVSFASEKVFSLGSIPITNTVLNTFVVDVALIAGALFLTKRLNQIPSLMQNAIEALIETFYNLTQTVAPNRAAKIFPYLATFFLFILISNWSGLIPGVGSIGFFHNGQLIPILRSTTSDLNTTLGLALVSAVATHLLSLRIIGIKEYFGRYFSLNPVNLYVGLLEIISEITKVISLSFRLFGNIFAGEVVLITISGIFAFIFPVPFLLLEFIVGFVQALVFAMLTMAFMAILSTPHHQTAKEVNHKEYES